MRLYLFLIVVLLSSCVTTKQTMKEIKTVIITEDIDKLKYMITTKFDSDINNKINGFVLLHLAVDLGKYTVVEYLINNNADVNIRDSVLCSPLHYAVLRQNMAIVKILIENKADVNAQSGYV